MPLDNDAVKKLTIAISAARKSELNFAYCLGKKPDQTILLMDKIKAPDLLARQAKQQGQTTKLASGTIRIDGSEATLRCVDEPPTGSVRTLKTFFTKSVGIKLKVALLDSNGQLLESEEDEVAELDGETSSPNTDTAMKWAELFGKMNPIVLKFLETNSGDTDRVSKAWTTACQYADEFEDPHTALKIASKIPALINEVRSREKGSDPRLRTHSQ